MASPVDLLQTTDKLVRLRNGTGIVHTPGCKQIRGSRTDREIVEITHPREIPLRADMCRFCDPDVSVPKDNGSLNHHG